MTRNGREQKSLREHLVRFAQTRRAGARADAAPPRRRHGASGAIDPAAADTSIPGMAIESPKLPLNHPERPVDTQIAIEPDFKALADAAEASGRSGEEVAVALLEVAIARIETRFTNLDTDEVVHKATERIAAVSDHGDPSDTGRE